MAKSFQPIPDFKDISIRWPGHPKYTTRRIIEDQLIEVIVQKLEMILFTNQGDVMSDINMGCSLDYYLWETQLANNNLKQLVIDQIAKYVPEMDQIGYSFDLQLYETPSKDAMILNFVIRGYDINFIFE